jgi:hypothetical protein
MNAMMIRSGLAALSLTVSVVQMVHAAAYSTSQPPVGSEQVPQDTKTVQSDRVFAGQPSVAPIPNDRFIGGAARKPAPLRSLPGGNDYNWLAGGGG